MSCDHSVHVHLTVRFQPGHFIVDYDSDGGVLRIKERKSKASGVLDRIYWSAKHHALGKGETLPKRIIEAARAKACKEDIAHNATP